MSKIEVLLDLEQRCFDVLQNAEPGSADTRNVLKSLLAIKTLKLTQEEPDAEVPNTPEKKDVSPTEEPDQGIADEPADTEGTMDRQTLVNKLSKLNAAYDVNVGELIEEMGYKNVSSIPAAKYAELLRKAEIAAAGKGGLS